MTLDRKEGSLSPPPGSHWGQDFKGDVETSECGQRRDDTGTKRKPKRERRKKAKRKKKKGRKEGRTEERDGRRLKDQTTSPAGKRLFVALETG